MENKRILFNLASRSRPEQLLRVITNINEKCTGSNHIINIKLDDDDLSVKSQWISDCLSLRDFIQVKWGLSACKVHAINRDIPEAGWDIIVDIADDMVFTKKGFDDVIRQYCGPDDFLLFPEPYAKSQAQKGRNELIVIMLCMGYDYYLRDKQLFNPAFKSLFCDNFATNVAKVRGRLKIVNEDIFYHAHPAAGYGKRDEQYQHTESFWNEDKATYKRLMTNINDYR